MKRLITLLLAGILTFSLVACSDSNNNLNAEENSQRLVTENSEPRVIEVTEGLPSKDEYERFTVQLTEENIGNYLDIAVYNYYNSFDEIEGCVSLFKSLRYDEGWILLKFDDFAVIASYDVYDLKGNLVDQILSEEFVTNDLFCFPNYYFEGDCSSYVIKNLSISKAKGTFEYVSENIVDEYTMEADRRVVKIGEESFENRVRTKDILH